MAVYGSPAVLQHHDLLSPHLCFSTVTMIYLLQYCNRDGSLTRQRIILRTEQPTICFGAYIYQILRLLIEPAKLV